MGGRKPGSVVIGGGCRSAFGYTTGGPRRDVELRRRNVIQLVFAHGVRFP